MTIQYPMMEMCGSGTVMGFGESRMHLNCNIQCRVIRVHLSGVGSVLKSRLKIGFLRSFRVRE